MHIGGVKLSLFEVIILLLTSLVLCIAASAQTTAVTATITDTDGQTWNNGHWSATLYNPFTANPPSINGVLLTAAQMNLSGTLSGSGVLTGTSSDNSYIAPTGTQWYITICANANMQCSTGLTAITGASANLSTLFSSYTKPLRIPASWQSYMYRDAEIYPIPVPGGRYWNVTTLHLRCWNGSAWQDCNTGGGGGTPGEPQHSIQFNNPDGTFAGDANLTYYPANGGNGFLLLNDNQDGSITNLNIEAQRDSGAYQNEIDIDGQNISIFTDGGGTIVPRGMLGYDVEAGDLHYPGSSSENLSGYQALLSPSIVGRPVIGFTSSVRMIAGKAGTVEGYQADVIPTVPSTNYYSFHAKGLGADATDGDYAFFADDAETVNSNYCDVFTKIGSGTLRLSIGCGQTDISTFGGELDLNGASDPTAPTQLELLYNNAPTGVGGSAVLAPDVIGNLDINENNTGFFRVCTVGNDQCAAALNSTCNSNGCYVTYTDGTIESWGHSAAIGSTGSAFTTAITFPTTYASTTHLEVSLAAVTDATGDGNPHPADCHITRSTLTTSGATAIISISTQIGGSGYAALASGDYCSWHALGK